MANAKKAPKKTAKKAPMKPAPAPKKAAQAAPAPKPRPAAPKPVYAPPAPKPAAPPAAVPPAYAASPPAPPPRPQPKPQPQPAALEPEFVKRASFAEKKAALEALAEKEGVAHPAPPAGAAPAIAPPPFVKDSSPADRKAALEKVVEEQGVTGLLSKAPWKRPSAPTPPPAAPPVAANPADRTGPRVQMTKAPVAGATGRSAPKTVILDSNALMMQFQFHIDIEKEVNRLLTGNYHYVVPSIVVDELHRIAKEGATKEAAEARMAGELAKTFEIVDSPGDGDVGILRLAEKLNAVVVTNDKRLRATLRAKDIPNIYMRSRAFLTIEGHIPGQ